MASVPLDMAAEHHNAASGDSRLRARDTDATRYLCAAAYLDDRFSRLVLDEVLHQPHRAVAPSYGIDLGPIIRHCLEARRRRLIRDIVVTIALVGVLLFAVAGGTTLLLTIIGLWLLVQGVRMIRANAHLTGVVALVLGAVATLIAFRALGLIPENAYENSAIEEIPAEDSVWRNPLWWNAGILVAWAAYFWHRISVHQMITQRLTAQAFDGNRAPATGPEHESRLAYVEQAQRGNLTVYSQGGAVRPFIGSGRVATEWTLVTPLRPAQDPLGGLPPEVSAVEGFIRQARSVPDLEVSFDARVLYERTRDGLVALGHPSLPPHERINRLSVQDRVFVAGLLPPDSPFLDERRRPLFRLPQDGVEAIDRAERGQVRHYQTLRMAAWHGEMEVTTFLYIGVRGDMLFVEFVATELPGIHPTYHQIDGYKRLGPGVGLLMAFRAVRDLVHAVNAPADVGARLVEALRRALDPAADSREIERRLAFDYGARTSVREIGTLFSQNARFQDYDAAERILLVKRRLLEIIVDTMREYGFDVSDLAQQAMTIINNGTMVGAVTGSGIAVGQGASASSVTVKQGTPAK